MAEVAAILKEQREEAKADRADFESRLEIQRTELEVRLKQQRLDLTAAAKAAPAPLVSEQELAGLMPRVEAMRTAEWRGVPRR